MLSKVPHEIVASILAATTAFVGGNALHLPPWAIFIGWAGTYLAGGPHLTVMKRLWATMPVGATYALIIVLIDTRFGDLLGTSTVARDAMLALVILVVNTALMFTGRIEVFSLIPGMFFGFAAFFATYFGGFGWDPTNPWAAWISVIAMTALGPVYAWLTEWLVKPLPSKSLDVVLPERIDS
ncbi:MAG: DUF1097 domain-containing protein [Chloroflexota bacterium]